MPVIAKESGRKLCSSLKLICLKHNSYALAIYFADLSAQTRKVAHQSFSTPYHGGGRMKVCQRECKRLADDMWQLIITALKFIADRLGEAERGRAEKEIDIFLGLKRWNRIYMFVASRRVGGHCFNPSTPA